MPDDPIVSFCDEVLDILKRDDGFQKLPAKVKSRITGRITDSLAAATAVRSQRYSSATITKIHPDRKTEKGYAIMDEATSSKADSWRDKQKKKV